jgi:hypothetical protein
MCRFILFELLPLYHIDSHLFSILSCIAYDLLHVLNKKASVSSDILVGHVTSSQNESGLSKYLMVHE